jgi:diguanylate cyclase (GGDEF)-like protein
MLDPKLGIWNRAGVTGILRQQLRIASNPCAIAMIAIDRLDTIIDMHGLTAGDIVSRAVLRELRSLLHPEHEVGHCGANRLLLVLPATTAGTAEQLARRMSDAIALLSIDIPPNNLPQPLRVGCTVSIGVATWQQTPADTSYRLMKRANAALACASADACSGTFPVCLPRCMADERDSH